MKATYCLILLSSIYLIISKKKKKAQPEEFNPLNLKPNEYTYEYWCDICKNSADTIAKKVSGKYTESYVIPLIDDVCNPGTYIKESNKQLTLRGERIRNHKTLL
jgi:hypothetical protein